MIYLSKSAQRLRGCLSPSVSQKTPHLLTFSLGVLLLALLSTSAQATPLHEVTLTPQSLEKFKRLSVQVPTDPFYRGGELRAEGVALEAVLRQSVSPEVLTHPDRYLIRFICSDGYMSTYPLASLKGGRGAVLADRLISVQRRGESQLTTLAPNLKDKWALHKRGQKTESPGPYYLLWSGERYSEHRPWPYQLTSIHILPINHLAALQPNPADHVERGHQLYLTHCKSCHMINLVGGAMGPELNVPQNIMSYRDRAQVLAFIKYPQRFRLTSLMPPMTLTDQELNDILDYVTAMQRRRVCESLESCRALQANIK